MLSGLTACSIGFFAVCAALGDPIPITESPAAPPAPPAKETRPAPRFQLLNVLPQISLSAGLTLYSIGDPTDDEQVYLELINRARRDPIGEAELFRTTTDPMVLDAYDNGVDLLLMVAQFALIPPAPPVALNAQLSAAARGHSQYMLQVAQQQHIGEGGSTPGTRVSAEGYDWSVVGENIFTKSKSPWHGHAAFEVDWSGNPLNGGMQTPPGHRITIHDPDFKEVGIGIVEGSNQDVGPFIITQDFATRQNPVPLVTGVAFYDLNGNDFYDSGEGIEGVTVTTSGSRFYAVSAASGGYTLPLSGNGSYTLSFEVPGLGVIQRNATVSGGANVKVDLRPEYQPPVVSGPSQAVLQRANTFQFGPVAAAKTYQASHSRLARWTQVEGAENGPSSVNAQTSPNYSLIDGTVKASGQFSFHLAHPANQNESFALAVKLLLKPTSQLTFMSRLGWAAAGQIARAQVSTDDGRSWTDVWSQAGTDSRGETAFVRRSVSLAAFAGQEVRLRFLYQIADRRFPQTDPGVGFYVDDINISNADELRDSTILDLGTNRSFTLTPSAPGSYFLRARAKVARNFLPWGPPLTVTTTTTTTPLAEIRILSFRRLDSAQFQLDFSSTAQTGAVFSIQTAATLEGPWTADSAASVQAGNSGEYRAIIPAGRTTAKFFRVSL